MNRQNPLYSGNPINGYIGKMTLCGISLESALSAIDKFENNILGILSPVAPRYIQWKT